MYACFRARPVGYDYAVRVGDVRPDGSFRGVKLMNNTSLQMVRKKPPSWISGDAWVECTEASPLVTALLSAKNPTDPREVAAGATCRRTYRRLVCAALVSRISMPLYTVVLKAATDVIPQCARTPSCTGDAMRQGFAREDVSLACRWCAIEYGLDHTCVLEDVIEAARQGVLPPLDMQEEEIRSAS